MSTIIQLVQGSPQWHAHRRNLRNASETPAVLGVSPWLTPYQLWLLKTGRTEREVNAAMHHGTALEPLARHAYEVETGQVMQPLVLQDGPYSASLDGMTLDGQLIVEIKCPVRGQQSTLWQSVAAGLVPEHYAMQVQHQLMVSGAKQAHLWVFDGSRGLLHPVAPDVPAMARIREAWDLFAQYLASDTPPPLSERDALLRDDAEWHRCAAAFLTAKAAADEADTRLSEAKRALIDLTTHAREHGAGVNVTRFWKAGPIDYRNLPELRNVDLDAHRGPAREEVRITATR